MAFRDFFSSLLASPVSGDSPQFTNNVTPWGDFGWSGGGGTDPLYSNVSTSSAMQYLTVYGCNRFIVDGISTLPVGVFEGDGPSRSRVATPDIIEQPTSDLDRIAWSTQVLLSWLMGGNSYTWPTYNGLDLASALPLDPSTVSVSRVEGRKVFTIAGRQYTPRDIIHVPAMMMPGADVGLSPVEAAKRIISAGMAADDYSLRFFTDDSTPTGVIEVPGELTPDQARQWAASWSRAHSGQKNRKVPGVLSGGAEWKSTAVTNEQAQFLQTRGFDASAIAAQMYLIDPAEMGLPVQGTSLTYTNQEERAIRKVQVTFLPWIVRLESLYTRLCPDGQYAKINVSGLLRGDTKARYEAYKTGLDSDFITIDEVRAWEELPPLPDKATPPIALTDQIDALGALIRAGFEPDAACEFLGLPKIAHTGLVP